MMKKNNEQQKVSIVRTTWRKENQVKGNDKHSRKHMKKYDKASSRKCMNEKENKIKKKKTKENKASSRAYAFLHRGQTLAKETCSRMKQNQSTTAEMAWEWKKTKTEDSGAST